MVMLSAGDLGLEIDFGRERRQGGVLQRFENDEWRDYKPNGALVTSPFDLNCLPPGKYRLRKPE